MFFAQLDYGTTLLVNMRRNAVNLRQQLVEDRIDDTATLLGLTPDQAFMRLAHSLVVGASIHAFDPADLVDGGQDKQIDIFTIEESGDEAHVFLLQVKHTDSFSSNVVVQIQNGLAWIFHRKKKDVDTLTNLKFRDRIQECRSLVRRLGPANVSVTVAHVTNGLTADLSSEYEQESQSVRSRFDSDTFAAFSFSAWGADELVTRINALERKHRQIDCDIPMRYDSNNPSLIKYHANELKGIVCTASAKDIADIVNTDADEAVFDSNIRRFLGGRGAVNSDIHRTCSSTDTEHLFWFLNNGITIVCDSFDAVTDPDHPHLKIKNLQIVNGCQTAKTLALAEKQGSLRPNTRVLLRIYETRDEGLVGRIVLTTNNQNRITARNLRSNDQVQLDMEKAFAAYRYLYERTPRQYDALESVDASRIVPNEIVGQSCLAIALKRPSDARRRKYLVWGDLYGDIFQGRAAEQYILAFQIYQYVSGRLRASTFMRNKDNVRRKLANNGAFHIARAIAYLWRKTDSWEPKKDDLRKRVEQLQNGTLALARHFTSAFSIVEKTVRADHFLRDLDGALKSHELDEAISSALHTHRKKSD